MLAREGGYQLQMPYGLQAVAVSEFEQRKTGRGAHRKDVSASRFGEGDRAGGVGTAIRGMTQTGLNGGERKETVRHLGPPGGFLGQRDCVAGMGVCGRPLTSAPLRQRQPRQQERKRTGSRRWTQCGRESCARMPPWPA